MSDAIDVDSVWANAPCNGCSLQKHCEKEEIACMAFRRWVYYGQAENIRPHDMIPTKVHFDAVFSEEDLFFMGGFE